MFLEHSKFTDIYPKEKIIYQPSGNNQSTDFQVYNEVNKKYIPCACMHGGSDWLCNKCSKRFFEEWKYNILNLKHRNG